MYSSATPYDESEQNQAGQFDTLISDMDRIGKRHNKYKKKINSNIDKVIQNLQQIQQKLDDMSDSMEEETEINLIQNCLEETHEKLQQQKPLFNIVQTHKEYFAYLSKVGKNIEKIFNKDINSLIQDYSFDAEKIYTVIGEHLLYEQSDEINSVFQEELEKTLDLQLKDKIDTMKRIANSIQNNDLEEALKWANENTQKLKYIKSNLLFNLHKQQFINISKNGENQKAVEYSRHYFLQFTSEHLQDIQKLVTSLICPDKSKSPYSELYEDSNIQKLKEKFVSDCCQIYQIPAKGALLITCTAGTLSLPQFIKLQNILEVNQEDFRSSKHNELQIDFEHGNQFKYHNIFVCPVSREPMEPSQLPVLLKCKHVISKQSFEMITSHQKKNFRCPICQSQQKTSDVTQNVNYN